MFSGIVETTGVIKEIIKDGTNIHFFVQSPISAEAYIDQSISHNGVCLTVVKVEDDIHVVTAIKETLDKTNLGTLKINDLVNLERSLLPNSRVDGHFVQGHVDTVATCISINEVNGSWYFEFETQPENVPLMVKKGSICVNGVSLTLVDVMNGIFRVAIIPYTYHHTNFSLIQPGDRVNIEFDVLGKYVVNYLALMQKTI